MSSKKIEQNLKKTLESIRAELETLSESIDDRRSPGGLEPSGVYWNGFYYGILSVLGRLQKYERTSSHSS